MLASANVARGKMIWIFFEKIGIMFYGVLSLLIASLSISSSDLILPSVIDTPIVNNASPNMSRDGFPLSINISISRYNLILHLNEMLISPHFSSTTLDKYNKQITRKKLKNCYYQGRLEPFEYNGNKFDYWNAAISLCQGLQGHFGNSMDGYIVIFPSEVNVTTLHQQHFLYHELKGNTRFTFDINPLQMHPSDNTFSFYQQEHLAEYPFIELQIVNDKYSYDSYGKDVDKLEFINAAVINEVDLLYNSLGIDVVISSIVTWASENKVDGYEEDENTLLYNFAGYNTEFLPYKYDVTILLSSFQFSKTLGISFLGGACQIFNAVFVGIKSTDVHFIASTIAHEVGHTLNMIHDEEYPYGDCSCFDLTDKCLMTVAISKDLVPAEWSTCSVDVAENTLQNDSYHCLFILFGASTSIFIKTRFLYYLIFQYVITSFLLYYCK